MSASPDDRTGNAEGGPSWLHGGRVPALDGVRAIAVALVLLSHFGVTRLSPVARNELGMLGVTVFFVLSGFLITLLMLREMDDPEGFSIRRFLARRALRILPAYYTYVVLTTILTYLAGVPPHRSAVLAALTFMTNFFMKVGGSTVVQHTWSLAVEQHFYLLWPIVVVALQPSRAWKVAIAYLALTPVIRGVAWWLHLDWLDVDYSTFTQMGSIATGCLLAFVLHGRVPGRWRATLLTRPTATLLGGAALLLLALVCARVSGKFDIVLGDPLNALASGLIIAGLCVGESGAFTRLLDTRPLVFVGSVSYSLYLWQQPFFDRGPLATVLGPFVRLGLCWAPAVASYFLVERPALRSRFRTIGVGPRVVMAPELAPHE